MPKSRAQKNNMRNPDDRKKSPHVMQMAINPDNKGALHKILGAKEEKKMPMKNNAKSFKH